MTSYFVISAITIAFACCTIWLLIKAFDGSLFAGVVLVLSLVVLLAFALKYVDEAKERGPCVQYETRMMFNTATKTMMPVRVCVLRGEWVEEPS